MFSWQICVELQASLMQVIKVSSESWNDTDLNLNEHLNNFFLKKQKGVLL